MWPFYRTSDDPIRKYWITKDGQQIKYADLTNDHITNIVKMLNRNAEQEKRDSINSGYACLSLISGEMALDAAESALEVDWDRPAEEFVERRFPELFAEYNKRKRQGRVP